MAYRAKLPPQLQPHHPTRGVELRIAGERLVERGDLIGELDGPEVPVGGLLELAAMASAAAVVDAEDGEAVLGEQLVEEGLAEAVVDVRGGRGSAVGVQDERDGCGRGLAGRQGKRAVELAAAIRGRETDDGRADACSGRNRRGVPERRAGGAGGDRADGSFKGLGEGAGEVGEVLMVGR